jgi:ABC-type sugar transport system ATPase subunit
MKKDDSEVPVVKMIKATKIYGGSHAIRDVDLDLYEGEIHALAGENGAGKSTLMKALSGAIRLTSGNILLNGAEQSFNTPHDALKAGISMVYQEPDLVNEMTVGQNIFLGNEKVLMRMRTVFIGAQQILQSMKFGVDTAVKVERLGEAKKRMVEIARAILFNPKVIIFDEPTATMTPEEKMYLFSAIRSLASRKISVLFISHALEESLELADRITVLRDGEHIITADAKTM